MEKGNEEDSKLFDLVMLIDDSVTDVQTMEILLTHHNFCKRNLKFSSAIEALKYFNSPSYELPVLLFLDLNMPLMNGFEFLDKLQQFQQL